MLSDVQIEYALKTAERLSSGLKLLEKESFDIILLDLGLPDSSGIETFLTIQDKASDLPVIVLTVLADEELAAEAIARGGQDYLVKGQINGNLLVRSIRYSIERKRLDKQLRRMNRRTELILATAGEGLLELHTEGTIIFLNNAAAGMLGYAIDELTGKNCRFMYHHSMPDGTPYAAEECPIDAAFRRGIDHYGEEVFWRKDGTSFPIDYTSKPLYEENKIVGAVVTFRDISGRKRVETALARSKTEFEAIFNSLSDAAIFADTERRILQTNPAFTNQFGYTLEEVKGKTTDFLYLRPANYYEQGKRRYHRDGNAEHGFFEIQYRRKDGTVFLSETSGIQVRDANGKSSVLPASAGILPSASRWKRKSSTWPAMMPLPAFRTSVFS